MTARSGTGFLSSLKRLVRPIVPVAVRGWHRRRMIRKMRPYYADRSTQDVFTEIYENNLWGGEPGDFFSGDGSAPENAMLYCNAISSFILEKGIKSIVDLGCGDFRVGSRLLGLRIPYTGVDIVPELIRRNNAQFASTTVQFQCLDITQDPLPPGELCLIRQVLQHLSNAQIMRVLDNCRHYKYLIITEHYPDPRLRPLPNLDKPHGPDVRLTDRSGVYLDLPPFNKAIAGNMCEVTDPRDQSVIRTMLIEQS